MLLAALTSVAILQASAAPVAKTEAFASFERLCIANQANALAAAALADAEHWEVAPARQPAPGSPHMISVVGRTKSSGTARFYLMAGRGDAGDSEDPHLKFDLCNLLIKHVDATTMASINADVSAWAAVSPASQSSSKIVYTFTEESGGHTAIINPSDIDAKAAFKAGKVRMLSTTASSDSLLLSYFIPRM